MVETSLPAFPLYGRQTAHNPFGEMSEITVRHLMSHSAGFRNPTWIWRDDDKDWQPFEPPHWEQLAAMMPYTEVLFKPGSRFSYSNPGVIYLGRIIELLSHDDYEVYIDKNIFKPLEMYRSYFDSTPAHLLKHRSHSYYVRDGKHTPARFDADTGITVSNGGLNSPLPHEIWISPWVDAGLPDLISLSLGPSPSPGTPPSASGSREQLNRR